MMKRKAVFICGPTASGKSALALQLATELRFKKPISLINCDSVQVYQDLLIGSASPSAAEKAQCPHFLYNYIQFPQEISLGSYYRDFAEVLSRVPEDEAIFVVGGSGFYLQALEFGLFDMPAVPEEIRFQVQCELKEKGPEVLFEELKMKDPATAQRIHVNDHYRLTRAVEVIRSNSTTMTAAGEKKQKLFELETYKIGLQFTKEELLARVQKRTHQMLEQGIIEETQKMMDLGRSEWSPLSSVGYHEVKEFLLGRLSRSSLEAEINLKTMQLIKKQMTWFKRDQSISWTRPEDLQDVQRDVAQFLLGA